LPRPRRIGSRERTDAGTSRSIPQACRDPARMVFFFLVKHPSPINAESRRTIHLRATRRVAAGERCRMSDSAAIGRQARLDEARWMTGQGAGEREINERSLHSRQRALCGAEVERPSAATTLAACADVLVPWQFLADWDTTGTLVSDYPAKSLFLKNASWSSEAVASPEGERCADSGVAKPRLLARPATAQFLESLCKRSDAHGYVRIIFCRVRGTSPSSVMNSRLFR
jgi:hypothetical protein